MILTEIPGFSLDNCYIYEKYKSTASFEIYFESKSWIVEVGSVVLLSGFGSNVFETSGIG